MSKEYLQSTVRERIRDLMSERKMTVAQLAGVIRCDETTLGRYLRGDTKKISDEQLIAIAGEFCVSLDFLLGETNIPDKLHFELADLGLSVRAAQNLYSGKTKPKVVNLLLESDRFAKLTTMLAHYFDDTFAAGYAAQNQIYNMIGSMLLGIGCEESKEAAETVDLMRTPINKPDLTAIGEAFTAAVREIKKQQEDNMAEKAQLSREVLAQFRAELMKGRDASELPKLTPDDIVNAIARVTANAGGSDDAQRLQIIEKLTPAFLALISPIKADERSE